MELRATLVVSQELKFGQMMLKRAARELERIERKMKSQEQDVEAVALLENRYKELCAGIQSFANELRTYQCALECALDRENWSAS